MASRQIEDSIDINALGEDLAKVLYKKQLNALVSTCDRFHISRRDYTLLGKKDESTCLEFIEGLWSVYFFERGGKTNEKVSKDIDEACEFVLYEMAESKDEYEVMKSFYQNELGKRSADDCTSYDFYEALKNGIKRAGAKVAII